MTRDQIKSMKKYRAVMYANVVVDYLSAKEALNQVSLAVGGKLNMYPEE